jgi:hypothetical protein
MSRIRATLLRSSMAGKMMKASIMRLCTPWLLLGGMALGVSPLPAQAPPGPVSPVSPDQPGSRPPATRTAATEAQTAKHIQQAETRYQAVLAVQPGNPVALTGMGSIRIQQRNFPGAISYLEQARQIQPRDKALAAMLETARFWFYMDEGHHSLVSNELTAAERRYLSALELRPDSRQAFAGLHTTLVKALLAQPAIPPVQYVAPAPVPPPQLVAQTPVAVPQTTVQTPPPDSTHEVVYGPFVPYVPPSHQPQGKTATVASTGH